MGLFLCIHHLPAGCWLILSLLTTYEWQTVSRTDGPNWERMGNNEGVMDRQMRTRRRWNPDVTSAIKERVTRSLVDPCENCCRNGTMRARRSSELHLLFDSGTTSSLIWKISHKSGNSEKETQARRWKINTVTKRLRVRHGRLFEQDWLTRWRPSCFLGTWRYPIGYVMPSSWTWESSRPSIHMAEITLPT